MKRLMLGISILVMGVVFTSCTPEEHTEEKNSAVITLTDPLVNDTLHHADTLKIRGTVVSTMDMHGYNVSIRRTSDHSEVFFWDDHYHGTNKNLNIDWPCDLSEDVQLELKLTAVLDHDGSAVFKSVKFFCKP